MNFPSGGPESATAELSPTTAGGVRDQAPRRPIGEDVIQKNWQELIRPNKLQVAAGAEPARIATVVAEPLERGFGVTLGNALRRGGGKGVGPPGHSGK